MINLSENANVYIQLLMIVRKDEGKLVEIAVRTFWEVRRRGKFTGNMLKV